MKPTNNSLVRGLGRISLKPSIKWLAAVVALVGSLALANLAPAQTELENFQNFNLATLYPSWNTATIVSGPTSYSVTATNYGSGYAPLAGTINGSGNTTIELTVDISDVPSSGMTAVVCGPLADLYDEEGDFYAYAWYGLGAGHYVLTNLLSNPTIKYSNPSGYLDITNLTSFHLEVDTGGGAVPYTITFDNLRLTNPATPPPTTIRITSESYNPATQQLTLTWTSVPSFSYSIEFASSLPTSGLPSFSTTVGSGIMAAAGSTTTATITVPGGSMGYIRISQP